MIERGATTDQLSAAYMENLRELFGDALEVGDEFRWEWVSIPHSYNVPFYVYAYTFGQLLVLSLYQQFKQDGEDFKPRYIDILAAGGSASPERILTEAGIDMYDPAFWQGGFDVLDRLVQQLEALPVPRVQMTGQPPLELAPLFAAVELALSQNRGKIKLDE